MQRPRRRAAASASPRAGRPWPWLRLLGAGVAAAALWLAAAAHGEGVAQTHVPQPPHLLVPAPAPGAEPAHSSASESAPESNPAQFAPLAPPAAPEPAPGLRPPQPAGALGLKPGEAGGAGAAAPLATEPGADASSPGMAIKPEKGLASWYGERFHQRRTASGERFDMHAMTAAHPTLAFGTLICVRSQVTGRAVVVRVNDRGPHARGRIVDLSRAAALELGLHGLGLKPVAVTPLAPGASACPEEKRRGGEGG